ncbi:MAG: TIGR03084 family metal-binding protein [Acidimicrobiales bacterium]
MTTISNLLEDLEAEYQDLRRLVSPLGSQAREWDLPTPAEGWAVRDQISHLAYFDVAAHLAVAEPQKFALMAEAFMAQEGDPMEGHLTRGRSMDGTELVEWWERSHDGLADVLETTDPKARIPWFGPPMGMLSFVSARLMETWAHGQDVADALGVVREPTDRLRHVAHLGVKARPYSYLVRGRDAPPGRIDVILVAPSGEEWIWQVGELTDGGDVASVAGPAEEFCLVVTQRRNVADTALNVEGDTAAEWMSVAQAYAGPAGPGRPPAK